MNCRHRCASDDKCKYFSQWIQTSTWCQTYTSCNTQSTDTSTGCAAESNGNLCPIETFEKISTFLNDLVNVVLPGIIRILLFPDVLEPTLYLTYRSPLFSLEYFETKNTYCYRNGNSNSFSDLDVAKVSCSADDDCVGLYDNCGSGREFRHCTAPLTINNSSCGSILYQPRGK